MATRSVTVTAGFSLGTAYLLWHLLSALVTASIGYWVFTRTEVLGRRVFVALMAFDTLWALSAAVEIASTGRVPLAAMYVREFSAVTVTVVWFGFATVYTGRSTSLRRPLNAAVVIGYVLLAGSLLTNPLHGAYWESAVLRETPFVFYEVATGPLGWAAMTFAGAAVSIGIYYVLRRFVRSRHRPSLAVLALGLGAVGATLPFLFTLLGFVPVPGWNHSSIGIIPFVLGATVAVFRLGIFDVVPLARHALVDELEDVVLVLDPARRILDYNRSAAALAPAFRERDPSGQSLSSVLPAFADDLSVALEEGDVDDEATAARVPPGDGDTGAVDLGGSVSGSTNFATEPVADPDGSSARTTFAGSYGDDGRHHSVRVSPIVEGGRSVGWLVIVRDVTPLVTSRRRLERQNERLETFADTVSHDLRNPLNVAQGRLALVREERDSEHLDPIEDAHERMHAIIDDVLAAAKEGRTVPDPEPVALDEAARRAWDAVSTGNGTLVVESDRTLHADPSSLDRLLANLFRNSVEHGPTGSQVGPDDSVEHGPTGSQVGPDDSVEHGHTTVDESTVTVAVGSTADGFYVEDDGVGIDRADRAAVLEAGYSTNAEGTGLGLDIVRRIATAHDWEIRIDEATGGGARFVFTVVDDGS